MAWFRNHSLAGNSIYGQSISIDSHKFDVHHSSITILDILPSYAFSRKHFGYDNCFYEGCNIFMKLALLLLLLLPLLLQQLL